MDSIEHIKRRLKSCWSRRNSKKPMVRAVNRQQVLTDVAELRFRRERDIGYFSHSRAGDALRITSPNFVS